MNRIGGVLPVIACAALAAHAPRAAAEPASPVNPAPHFATDANGYSTGLQVLPHSAFTHSSAADTISPIIFLNRCASGCSITAASVNNAATQQSTIPQQAAGTVIQVTPFPYDDTAWNLVLSCAQEVYSPFNVQVTDVDPGPTVVHHEIIVAGTAAQFNLPTGVLGISPVSADHSPVNNNISYAFAGSFSSSTNIETPYALYDLCATVGQETAHSWGLDHEFVCVDPMTYLNPCGGVKYFRNVAYPCGTAAPGDCNCRLTDGTPTCSDAGPTQNSHQRILSVFGAGTIATPAPTATLTTPTDASMVVSGFPIQLTASGKRGIFKLKLIVNGYQWLENDIDATKTSGADSSVYASSFQMNAPVALPDGIMDLEIDACDDLDQCAVNKVTVTKGAPCMDASTCAKGQTCDAGKCEWAAPSKNIGDSCTYPQECLSDDCVAAGGGNMICSETCFTGLEDTCPDPTECQLDSTGQGYCQLKAGSGGGCCSVGPSSTRDVAATGGLSVLVLAFALRRRRRAA